MLTAPGQKVRIIRQNDQSVMHLLYVCARVCACIRVMGYASQRAVAEACDRVCRGQHVRTASHMHSSSMHEQRVEPYARMCARTHQSPYIHPCIMQRRTHSELREACVHVDVVCMMLYVSYNLQPTNARQHPEQPPRHQPQERSPQPPTPPPTCSLWGMRL